MAVFIVIRVVDVAEKPVTGATVRVAFLDSNSRANDKKDPGVYELFLPGLTPESILKASIVVQKDGFFTVEQSLIIRNENFAPTVEFDGPQALNVRNLSMHNRGVDHNVEVNVVMGQLRDAFDSISNGTNASRLQSLNAFPVFRTQTPILDPTGSGLKLIRAGKFPVNQTGSILFAERTTVPKLLAIVHPGFPSPKPGTQEQNPLPYHLFFPPTVFWDDAYPFGDKYTDFIARYVNEPMNSDSATLPKGIANQCAAGGPKVVSIFPVGSKEDQMGTLDSEEAVLRLLREVNFFVQRMIGTAFPRQPVGPAAISCFSSGTRFLGKILQGKIAPEFHDKILRHVYLLDSAFALKGGGEDQASTDRFCKAVSNWYRKGSGRRSIRSYTQSDLYLKNLGGELPGAVKTQAQGATELESPSGTVLHAPTSFWKQAVPEIGALTEPIRAYNTAHQLIPAVFLEHAVTNSDFTP